MAASCLVGKSRIKFFQRCIILVKIHNCSGIFFFNDAAHCAELLKNIVEMMLDNADSFKLATKDNDGRTGFQIAKKSPFGQSKQIVDLIKRRMPSIALDN